MNSGEFWEYTVKISLVKISLASLRALHWVRYSRFSWVKFSSQLATKIMTIEATIIHQDISDMYMVVYTRALNCREYIHYNYTDISHSMM